MMMAADRDSIARQYACAYADVFDAGIAALESVMRERGGGADIEDAMLAIYLTFLSRWEDSHIVRKHGRPVAQSVIAEAQHWRMLALTHGLRDYAEQLATWDASLKRRGINPGTTADLTVATVFVAACCNPALVTRCNGAVGRGT